MSVDELIRSGLTEGARGFVPDAHRGLDEVLGRGRRRRRTRRLAVAGAGLAAALALGVGLLGPGTTPRAAVPAATPSPDPLMQLAEDSRLSEALVGSWSTAVLDEADVVATLARAGTSEHRDVVLGEMPLPVRVDLIFDERRYRTMFGTELTDVGTWHVKGGRLVLVPSCAQCKVVLLPTLEGGELRLTLLEDPSPDYLGIPDAVFAGAVYTSLPFERTPSSTGTPR